MRFKKPKFWDRKKKTFWSILLFPVSVLYLLILWITRIPSIFKTFKKRSIIICVGNIYIGGTGKTPLALELFKIVKSLGKKPSFIKKYYISVIDEIRMLRDVGETIDTKKREEAIKISESKGFDVAILDDGFQDFSIKPDLSILCFNSKQLVGNGLTIPAGPLREGLGSISRANCVVINGEDTSEVIKFEQEIKKRFKEKEINFFYSKYIIKNIEKFKNKELTAFAGIGNPSNFFDLLRENNLNLNKTYSFPDHHIYSQKDIDEIVTKASSTIVTTKKDYYRMNEEQKKMFSYVDVDLEIKNKEKFENLIKKYL